MCPPLGLTASVIISQAVAWGDSVTATTSFQEATKSDYLCLESLSLLPTPAPPSQCYRAHPPTEKLPPPTSQHAAAQGKKTVQVGPMQLGCFLVPITKKCWRVCAPKTVSAVVCRCCSVACFRCRGVEGVDVFSTRPNPSHMWIIREHVFNLIIMILYAKKSTF